MVEIKVEILKVYLKEALRSSKWEKNRTLDKNTLAQLFHCTIQIEVSILIAYVHHIELLTWPRRGEVTRGVCVGVASSSARPSKSPS